MMQTRALNKLSMRFAGIASLFFAACLLASAQTPSMAMPQVHLDAAGLAPRPIEDLTGTTIARHYALAWRDLAEALESNQAEGLSDEFVGFAKDHLTQRISEQQQAGVHTRIVDHGHHLKAVFYSTDGTAMQLFDEADIEIQTFDGNKLLDTQNAPRRYIVLVTPGADRWYVRDLEEVSGKTSAMPCHDKQAENCR
jgi:hypothetical protein